MLSNPDQITAFVDFFRKGNLIVRQKGEFIMPPGSPPQGLFYIVSGLVKAYDITKYGEENLLIIRKPGEILGATWAVTGQDRKIIYAALASTELLQITKEEFTDFIRSEPTAALPLIDMLVDMYRLHSERIMNLAYRTVRERLVSFLLNMGERFGQETDDGLLLNVPLRHQDIASSISATRETTGRELSALERQGSLTSKQSIIVLKDLDRLRRYLG